MLRFKKILVPIDFSQCSVAALYDAVDFGLIFGSQVELLHVIDPKLGEKSTELTDWDQTAARDALNYNDLMIAEMKRFADGVHPLIKEKLTYRIETGAPADAIIRAAEGEADLIVMGTHGRTGLERLFLGSVASEVIRRAPCPVLTMHAARSSPGVTLREDAA